MRFFDENRAFFTPYHSIEHVFEDFLYIITDPIKSAINLIANLSGFFLGSLPLAVWLISFNIPLLILLSFPVAMNLLPLNIPIVIAMALLSAPAALAVWSLGCAIYDAVDLVLSPIVDVARILTNVSATAVDALEITDYFDLDY